MQRSCTTNQQQEEHEKDQTRTQGGGQNQPRYVHLCLYVEVFGLLCLAMFLGVRLKEDGPQRNKEQSELTWPTTHRIQRTSYTSTLSHLDIMPSCLPSSIPHQPHHQASKQISFRVFCCFSFVLSFCCLLFTFY